MSKSESAPSFRMRRFFRSFLSCLVLSAVGIGTALAQAAGAVVPAGTEPRAIAVDPSTGRAFVANEFSNDVTVIEPGTRATRTVAVGKRPQYIAVNTRTHKVYVSNSQDASISVIDGATLAVTTVVVNGSGPFLVDEAANRIYMVRLGTADEVTYFNGNDNSFYTIALDSYSPTALALNPYTSRLYVATGVSGDVRVVDTTSPSDYPPTLSVGVWSKATGVAVDVATNRIYAVTQDARGPVAVIDGDSNAASFLAPAGHASGGAAVAANPFTHKAYFGFDGEIGILDGTSNALSFVPVSGTASAIEVNTTANVVYAITTGNELVAIDGNSGAATRTPIAAGARDLAIDPVANLVYVAGAGGVTIVQGTGAAGPAPALPPPPPTRYGFNVQGMWWASPGGIESGWGLDLAHQGNTLFATWFTYDTDGQPMWLVMSNGWRNGENGYTGELYRMSGPPLDGAFDATKVKGAKVGYASLAFVDADNGNFTANVNGVDFFRKITRFNFTAQGSRCTTGGAGGALPNYQDLWWRSSESGWGIFLTHQGDTMMLAWFTYGPDGRGTWLVASDVRKTANATYSGTLARAIGPAFNASPWDSSKVKQVPVGSVTITFTDADHATLAYSADAQSGSKSLTRFSFSNPKTTCQ